MINSNPTFCLARGKVFNRFDTKNPSRPCNINPVVQGALSKADSVQFQVDDTKVSRKEKFSILAGLGVPGTIIVAAKVTAVAGLVFGIAVGFTPLLFVVLGVVVYGIYCAKNHSNESIKNKIVELENKLNSLEKQGSGDVRESLKDEIKVLLAQLTQDKDSYPNEVLPKLDELNLRFLLELNDVLINDISEESDHTHDMNIKGITVPKELQTERVDWSVNLVGVL